MAVILSGPQWVKTLSCIVSSYDVLVMNIHMNGQKLKLSMKQVFQIAW